MRTNEEYRQLERKVADLKIELEASNRAIDRAAEMGRHEMATGIQKLIAGLPFPSDDGLYDGVSRHKGYMDCCEAIQAKYLTIKGEK